MTVAALLVFRWQASVPDILSGPFRVVDGDTLTFGRERLRLRGIDAPERSQLCGSAQDRWPCGARATAALRALLKEPVRCRTYRRDKYRRILVVCRTESIDVSAELVRAGHAVGYGGYAAEEAEARQARRGLWSGPFQRPDDWRKAQRDGAEPRTRLPGWLKPVWQW